MAKATQPVTINDLEFDALITETRTLEATVPAYSVEDGFSVSDAIILSPEKLSMTLYVTNTPVTWLSKHGSDVSRVDSVCKKLEEIYYKGEPVTIVTSDATYTDMAIESIGFTKSLETGYAREIPISFVKIRVTTAKTTTIPDSYGKSGKTQASAGTANTSTVSSGGGGGSSSGQSYSSSYSSSSGSSGGTSSGSSSSGSSSSSGGGGSSSGGKKGSILYNAASAIGLI